GPHPGLFGGTDARVDQGLAQLVARQTGQVDGRRRSGRGRAREIERQAQGGVLGWREARLIPQKVRVLRRWEMCTRTKNGCTWCTIPLPRRGRRLRDGAAGDSVVKDRGPNPDTLNPLAPAAGS